MFTYHLDCAEFEHTLVSQLGQVQQDIRHMLQGIGDKLIQALHGWHAIFRFGKVRQVLPIFTPHLVEVERQTSDTDLRS